MKMKKFELAIYDLDGTLLDTSIGVLESVKYTINYFGLDQLSDEELISFIGPPIQNSFAKKYKLEGKAIQEIASVFRDRYKAEGIYSEKHLYNCIKYIYNNPVKAGICNKAEEYPYSNYKIMKTKFKERYSWIANSECNNEEYVFIDVDEKNEMTCSKIIEAYLKENMIDLKSIRLSKDKLKELIVFLKDENKISLRKIAEEIEISRETVRKLYNQ